MTKKEKRIKNKKEVVKKRQIMLKTLIKTMKMGNKRRKRNLKAIKL